MNRRLATGALAVAVALSACGGLTDSPAPGASMEKLCEAARALAEAVDLARESTATGEAGAGRAAADLADKANTRRQDGMALVGLAGALEAPQDPATPGYGERVAEIRAAQEAVDLAVGVLGSPAAPVTVEARSRLIDAADAAVRSIELPARCLAVETSPPSP